MNEEEFWEIVRSVKNLSFSVDERPERLRGVLEGLAPEVIKQFDEIYFNQIIHSYRWDIWGAAYVINGGCSDDEFKCFCDFLISEGRETFEAALQNPESLALLDELEDPELEEFGYAAADAYENKTGSELPSHSRSYPDEPLGEAWDEESVYELYPDLAAKFW